MEIESKKVFHEINEINLLRKVICEHNRLFQEYPKINIFAHTNARTHEPKNNSMWCIEAERVRWGISMEVINKVKNWMLNWY